MKLKLPVFAGLLMAACVLAGCNKPSSETSGTSTNVISTNLMYPDSTATNEMLTNSLATNLAAIGVGAWQSTKAVGSNAWNDSKYAATNSWEATKDAGSNAWQSTKEFSTNMLDKARAAFAGAAGASGVSTNYFGYDFSMKDHFVSEAQTNLDELDNRIAKLSGKAARSSTMPDLQQAVQMVRDKRTDLGNRFDDIKNATADNWDNTKAAYTKSYYDTTAAMKAASDAAKADM